MITPRSLYSSAPRARTKAEDNPTLLVSWWCTGFALAIIGVRLAGRYIRAEKLFREDKIIAWSMFPLLARMGLVHLILIWGTNNATTTGLTEIQLRNREMGSKLVLASRILYAAFLWIAKYSISEFLKRLTNHVWKRSYEIGLQFVRWFLVLTFVAVVTATLAECQPFPKYWQLRPDPGPRCRQGYVQLLTMGTSDILTDILLVCFPVPIIIQSTLAFKRKVSLVLLFGLSLVLVGITLYRIVAVIDRHSEQQFRSLLASLEILAAAAVSNALVLGSLVRDRGAKKQRFRFSNAAESSNLDRAAESRRETMTARNWGSDADLVGDVGIRVQPGLSADEGVKSHAAPMAIPLASQAKNLNPSVGNPDRAFQEQSDDAHHSDVKNASSHPKQNPASRRLSFFDVGGLLDDNNESNNPVSLPRYSGTTSHSHDLSTTNKHPPPTSSEEFTIHHNQQGRNALLQDIGGLLASESSTARSPPPTKRASGPHHTTISPPALNDVGGLLT